MISFKRFLIYLLGFLLILQISQEFNNAEITPNFLPSADFIEFWLSLSLSCGYNRNATKAIPASFNACLEKIDNKTDGFETFKNYCLKRKEYLNCWNDFASNLKVKCGNGRDDSFMIPGVYRGTFNAYCGNDVGESLTDILTRETMRMQRNPFLSMMIGIQCLGVFWREACEKEMKDMASPDLCVRHSALEKCLLKTTCNASPTGRLSMQVYSKGRDYIGCSRRNSLKWS